MNLEDGWLYQRGELLPANIGKESHFVQMAQTARLHINRWLILLIQ